MKLPVIIIISLLLSSWLSGQSDDSLGFWKVGVAKVDITPRDTMWMAGYGSRTEPAKGTLHPIWAKALALEDSLGQRAVLVTLDLVGIPKKMGDIIRDKCKSRYDLQRSEIILNSSHTHTGPVLQDALFDIYPLSGHHPDLIRKYSTDLIDAIVKIVGTAFGSLQTATIQSGNGISRIQVNRRNNVENQLYIQSELRGPNDYAVPVLKICRPSGELIALTFGYACHPTVLDTILWSGDYPGFAQIEIEKNHPGTMALFFQGAGADQNPLPRRTIPLARQYGRTLAIAVERVLEEEMIRLAPILTTAYDEIELSLNDPPTRAELVEYRDSIAEGYQLTWTERIIEEMDAGKEFPDSYPYPIQVWQLGQQSIFALGGEVTVGYSLRLKEIFGRDIFVMGYCNDVMSYIPTASILHEGGYEGCSAQMVYGLTGTWKFDSENRIVSSLTEIALELGVPVPKSKLIHLKDKE